MQRSVEEFKTRIDTLESRQQDLLNILDDQITVARKVMKALNIETTNVVEEWKGKWNKLMMRLEIQALIQYSKGITRELNDFLDVAAPRQDWGRPVPAIMARVNLVKIMKEHNRTSELIGCGCRNTRNVDSYSLSISSHKRNPP